MPKESVLTAKDKESISIDKLIFHIIIQDKFKPEYLDEVEITDEQKEFFTKRLIDVAEGTQYLFTDIESNTVNSHVKSILENPEENFIPLSKKLTASFKQLHTKNTNDGVFIVVIARIQQVNQLVFLLKLDHKKVFEYKKTGNKALLEEVKNTFVEDKTAIQKVALIDISNNYKWDVLAYDRAKPSSITDYFRRFLNVIPRETPTDLTKRSISLTQKWAVQNKDLLDSGQEISSYKHRAINYLKGIDLFNSDKFIENVIQDEDVERRELLRSKFKEFLELEGLAGQSFTPNKNAITKREIKNVRETSEGVQIVWEGDPSDSGVNIPNEKSDDGLFHIVIKTSQIIEKQ